MLKFLQLAELTCFLYLDCSNPIYLIIFTNGFFFLKKLLQEKKRNFYIKIK